MKTSFKEEFPSLKHECDGKECEKFCWFEISVACLDVQRVREAIKKHLNGGLWDRGIDVAGFIKELGLDGRG